MAVFELHEFDAKLPPKGALLGLDLGAKTIGLAICDIGRSIASPFLVIRRTKFTQDIVVLHNHIREHQICGLVIGLPLGIDGEEGPRCQSVRSFARNFLKTYDIPVCFWDERFSTQVMQDFLIHEADLSRQKRAKIIDKMAACYILQGALDAINAPHKTHQVSAS
jgi:putative Holliday junction resolvase